MIKEVIPAVLARNYQDAVEKLGVINARGGSVHIDIMDGQLVNNATFDLHHYGQTLRSLIRELTTEWHLMVRSPLTYLHTLLMLGAARVIIHQESFYDLERLEVACQEFAAVNIAVSVTAFPENPWWMSRAVTAYQVMGVEPGRAGQSLLIDTPHRVSWLRQRQANNDMMVSVDGGVTFANAPLLAVAGADRLVMNSAFWAAADPDTAITQLVKGGHGVSSSN